jgi:1,2-diacylglycerol 3-beta-glucosyltransferase
MAFLALAFLIPASLAAGYYFLLSMLGWHRTTAVATAPATRFAVLIPAHDEEIVLPATLAALAEADYPAHLLHVTVIADNCIDRTAEIARTGGVACIEREDRRNRGKGFALAAAIPQVLMRDVDAVLILDADCRVSANLFRELDARFANGADVVQAAVAMGDPRSGTSGLVMATGAEIENAVQAGVDRLCGTVRLRGTGMAFRREVLGRFPWNAFGLAEDAEYGAILRAGGVRVRFVGSARVQNSPPADTADLCQQRRRWREALFVGGRGRIERWLASKPLVLGQLGLAAIVGLLAGPEFAAWAGVLVLLTATVYLRAMVRVGATFRNAFDLWRAPVLVFRLALVTLAGTLRRGQTWDRTPRVAT